MRFPCAGIGGYGGPTVGLFGGATTKVVDKYLFSGDSRSAGSSLTTTLYNASSTGSGNVAIFGGGYTTATVSGVVNTNKYTYGGDVTSAGTNLGTAHGWTGAAGNSNFGLVAAGANTSSAAVTTVDKYTYSGDSVAAGTALGTARHGLAGVGGSAFALFGGGFAPIPVNYATVDKYTYSGDSVAAGTALGTARRVLAATGSPSLAIFGGGSTATSTTIPAGGVTTTDKYTYLTDARVAGTVLTVARSIHGATGNDTFGIFGGGANTGSTALATIDKYIFSGDAVSASGATLGTARSALSAPSSNGAL